MISTYLHALLVLAAILLVAGLLPPIMHMCLMLGDKDMEQMGYQLVSR